MKKCDICNQEYEGTTCVIFIPGENYCHLINNRGKTLFICVECFMSYLAQYMKMTNKEITEWLNWSRE